ncbi:MAG: proline--tRNA ligase [Candidatus Thermoplasmatota archaeon]
MLSEDAFSEWYNAVIEKAALCDKRYPVKGMNVWTPYGWRIMTGVDALIRREMDATGHEEVMFPMLIPATEFEKEAQHIKGFSSEVYWVTRAGDNPLAIPLLLRPTSEAAMYPLFKLWIRSHADLPLKVFQIVNTFRYETKMTRSFIRVREIHFFEAHTCHASFEDAEAQIQEDLEIWKRIANDLSLPYLTTKRPDWDKFAGAHYTISFDVLMPTGRTLQLASVHQYMENFARAFDIKYEGEDGGHRFVHQTTYGMSERILGALIGVHGDGKGLRLPPSIAPVQVVIVPIPAKGAQERVNESCTALLEELKAAGLRAHLDLRDLRPGNKFYDWESKGVPLRAEVGPKDLKKGTVVLVRRDTGEKVTVDRAGVVQQVRHLLSAVASGLLSEAETKLRAGIFEIESLDAVPQGVLRFKWCMRDECGREAEERSGFNILGTLPECERAEGTCAVCGTDAKTYLYAARSY